jgi:hypothetical protein
LPRHAGYAEVLQALIWDPALIPWQRPYQVPTAATACTWRQALGPAPLERLQERVLAGVDGEHRGHDFRAVILGSWRPVRSTGR